MFALKTGNIEPGIGVGILKLGMSFSDIKQIITEYEIDDLSDYYRIICEDVKIWMNKEEDRATQILVYGSFEGKYAGVIGIGSTLGDVKNILKKSWHDALDVEILDDAPGMSFEFAEEDDDDDDAEWDELTAPIGYIAVYPADRVIADYICCFCDEAINEKNTAIKVVKNWNGNEEDKDSYLLFCHTECLRNAVTKSNRLYIDEW